MQACRVRVEQSTAWAPRSCCQITVHASDGAEPEDEDLED